MQYKSSLIVALLVTSPIHAVEMERSTITSCAYQGGTAREIQTIRQSEGDDWSEFEQNIKKIYKEGQGRSDLLAIAKNVYLQPINTSPEEAYDVIFASCVKRIQGTESSA
ncbi:MAG: hypothetical protein HRT93_10985 [Piscirickettsiaceae bacterium]|nr:hypothetical protein [Piscirickettsiaceae bacterium]